MFKVTTTVEPTTWPVTLDEVKRHLNVTHDDDDQVLTALYKQVTKSVESYCGIAIGTQTKQMIYDYDYGNYPISIPYGPVISLTSVQLWDSANVYTTLVTINDYDYEVGSIRFYNSSGRTKIIYMAGYTAANIPADLKLGILNEIAFRYVNRGDQTGETKDGFSLEAYNLIIRHKDFSW